MAPEDVTSQLTDAQRTLVAVAGYFDPNTLFGTQSLIEDERNELIDGLASMCDQIEVDGQYYWSLRKDVRRSLIQQLRELDDLAELVDQAQLKADDLFGHYMRLGLKEHDLAEMFEGAKDPDSLLRAARFVDYAPTSSAPGIDADPAQQEPRESAERSIRRQAAKAEAEKMLDVVIPPRLVGRDHELAALDGYSSTVLSTDSSVPLFAVTGPGGVGKSALISRFIVKQREAVGAAPLVHLDFDRPSLAAVNEFELTMEFTRQLGHFSESLTTSLSSLRQRAYSVAHSTPDQSFNERAALTQRTLFDLAEVLSEWAHRTGPVMVVLDTFEEVAIRGEYSVFSLLTWVNQLRDDVGLQQLHVVVSGREIRPYIDGTSEQLKGLLNVWDQIELGDLDHRATVELYEILRVDSATADQLADVYGGNPLLVKLLSSYVETASASDVQLLIDEGRDRPAGAPGGAVGLQFVYERILTRIGNPDVKKLAHPGLLLRRVTPDVIENVLAGPCDIDLVGGPDAADLFSQLALYVWLVRSEPGVVFHRKDIRRLMLPGLLDGEIAEEIHRAAATYYEGHPDGISPSEADLEAAYHRGFLGEVPTALSEVEARSLVERLRPEIDYWPSRVKALLESMAGRSHRLTEDEVQTLEGTEATKSRVSRAHDKLNSGDIVGAELEGHFVNVDDDLLAGDSLHRTYHEDTFFEVPFASGDFEALVNPQRAQSAIARYFVQGRGSEGTSAVNLTRDVPWITAISAVMLGRHERLIDDSTIDAVKKSQNSMDLIYALAVASVVHDHEVIVNLTDSLRVPTLPARIADHEIQIIQAAISHLDSQHLSGITIEPFPAVRLSWLAQSSNLLRSNDLDQKAEDVLGFYSSEQTTSQSLGALLSELVSWRLNVEYLSELHAIPTRMPYLYAAVKTTMSGITPGQTVDVVEQVSSNCIFWPNELRADRLDGLRSLSSSINSSIIEAADRCGKLAILVDRIAEVSANPELADVLASGIRTLENRLYGQAEE